MQYTDDPIADFNAYDRERQEWLDSLPVCAHCKEPIQDRRYFEIEGENVCRECLTEYCEEHFEKENRKIEW